MKTCKILTSLFLIFNSLNYAGSPKVEYEPMSIWGVQEIGQIKSGTVFPYNKDFDTEWIDHYGAALTQVATINDILKISFGLGGVFKFPKPETVETGFYSGQNKGFAIGPTIAKGEFTFGDPEMGHMVLGLGLFPYKYNPTAHNLGEYLFRSTAYPSTIVTGGLTMINSSAVPLQGIQGGYHSSNFNLDVLGLFETSFPPIYDISLAVVGNYKLMNGLVDIGAGVNFKRIIPMFAELTQPKALENAYWSAEVAPGNPQLVSGFDQFYNAPLGFYEVWVEETDSTDLARLKYLQDKIDSITPIRDYIKEIKSQYQQLDEDKQKLFLDTLAGGRTNFYTNQAVILMRRLTIDPKAFMESDLFGSEDMKLYGEVALLGYENYPLFYEKKQERIPMMFGFNLPGFNFLDLIAVQFELWKSPYLNSHLQVGAGNWGIPSPSDKTPFSKKDYLDATQNDDWSWTVLVQKNILSGISFSLQFARDHYRTVGPDWWYGSRVEPVDIMYKSKDWYWATQVSWGI